jgi:hypothetical protein
MTGKWLINVILYKITWNQILSSFVDYVIMMIPSKSKHGFSIKGMFGSPIKYYF